VPDWLRTRDYLLAAAGPLSERTVQTATSLLAKRQRLMATPGTTFEFYVYESALRTRVGSARIMAEQVEAIMTLPRLHPNVSVRVITGRAEIAPPLLHGFELRDNRQVVLTVMPGAAVITADADVQPFRTVAASLRESALTEAESQGFLLRLATAYRLDADTKLAC
jgi:hypothetical protein